MLKAEDAPAAANLHITGIRTGFISSLGADFVMVLYEAIANSENSFGLVAEKEGNIVGFIAFSDSVKSLYKYVLRKKGLRLAMILAGKIFSWKRIRNIFQTLFYPQRTNRLQLPAAELLSIVVAEPQRGTGLSSELIREGFFCCRQRGIEKVKVLVGSENGPANRLYRKCGFKQEGQILNHGILSNVYVGQTNYFQNC
jgi:ribosomal protein S18 acetylase RimI-like enzyme